MARIVLAMATTHGPQLHTTVEQWALRVKADQARKHPYRREMRSFDELVAMRSGEGLEAKSSPTGMAESHRRCQAGMRVLAAKWDEIKPDIAVVLGNDQNEMFETEELNPAFFVFCGEKIPNYLQTQRAAAGCCGSRAWPRDRDLYRIRWRARSRPAHRGHVDRA